MRIVMLLGVLALTGCAATDPLERDGLWKPAGVNDANLAAMVANPEDLVHGHELPPDADGQLAAAAVARLRLGKVKTLPDSGITDLRVQSSPASPDTGAPATGVLP